MYSFIFPPFQVYSIGHSYSNLLRVPCADSNGDDVTIRITNRPRSSSLRKQQDKSMHPVTFFVGYLSLEGKSFGCKHVFHLGDSKESDERILCTRQY